MNAAIERNAFLESELDEKVNWLIILLVRSVTDIIVGSTVDIVKVVIIMI